MKRFLFLLLLILPQTVFAASVQWETEYTVDATKENPTYEHIVSIQPTKPRYYYKEFTLFSPFDIQTAEVIGGKTCMLIRLDSKSYLCKFEEGLFNNEIAKIKFTGFCNCTQSRAISFYVALPGQSLGNDMEGYLKETLIFPKDFEILNTTIEKYELKENTIFFSTSLSSNQNTKDILGDLFFEFRKNLNFTEIKTKSLSKFTINYPSGFEKEADKILKGYEKVIVFLEKESNLSLQQINVKIIDDKSAIGDWDGLTDIFSSNITLSADSFDDAYLHELCHSMEFPYAFPSWFSEGHAINCDISLNKNLGFIDLAKEKENFYSNVSQPFILSKWSATDNYQEQKEANDLGYKYSYLFLKDLQNEGLSTEELFANLRQTFGNRKQNIETQDVLCIFNQTKPGLEPVFKKYKFDFADCEYLKTKKVFNFFLENFIYMLAGFIAIIIIVAIIRR